jgi:hypothetical protein
MAAKLTLMMLILTVKSKLWVLENKFANVFNIGLPHRHCEHLGNPLT